MSQRSRIKRHVLRGGEAISSARHEFSQPIYRSRVLTTYEGIKRTGPPQAIQKLREDLYMVQIALSETPRPTGSGCFTKRSKRRRRFSSARGGYQRGVCSIPVGRSKRGSQDGLDRPLDRARQSEGSGHGRKAGRRTQTAPRRTPARAAGTGGDQRALGKVVSGTSGAKALSLSPECRG